eukprot:15464018-Alexandrium_andersonii.AAC.1
MVRDDIWREWAEGLQHPTRLAYIAVWGQIQNAFNRCTLCCAVPWCQALASASRDVLTPLRPVPSTLNHC